MKTWTATVLALGLLAGAGAASGQGDAPNSEELYRQGYSAATGGNLDRAIELFRSAIEADPNNFIAVFDLGGAYEQLGDKDNAVQYYQKTVDLRPDFAEAQNQLATLYLLHRRDYDRALVHFQRALIVKDPHVDPRFTPTHTRTQALQNAAIAYAQKGQLGIAIAIANSFVNDPDVNHQIDRKLQTLVARATPGLETKLRQERTYLDDIRKLLYGGQPAKALERYQAIESDPSEATLSPLDRWDVYEGLGMGHAMTNDLQSAAKYFQKSADVARELRVRQRMQSLFNLACALSGTGQHDQAIAALDQVLWLEAVTRHDPQAQGKKPYLQKLGTDESLAGVRQSPAFAELVGRYSSP